MTIGITSFKSIAFLNLTNKNISEVLILFINEYRQNVDKGQQ